MRDDDASRALILAFKYGENLEQAPAFGHWQERIGEEFLHDAELIVPVPLNLW